MKRVLPPCHIVFLCHSECNEESCLVESGNRILGGKILRPCGPQDDIRSCGPQDDIRSCGPQDDIRSCGPQDDIRPCGPQDDIRSRGPQDDICLRITRSTVCRVSREPPSPSSGRVARLWWCTIPAAPDRRRRGRGAAARSDRRRFHRRIRPPVPAGCLP